MLDGILNQGRPVWRLEGSDQFLYFNGGQSTDRQLIKILWKISGDSHWMISEDYEQPVGYIISAEQNLGKARQLRIMLTQCCRNIAKNWLAVCFKW